MAVTLYSNKWTIYKIPEFPVKFPGFHNFTAILVIFSVLYIYIEYFTMDKTWFYHFAGNKHLCHPIGNIIASLYNKKKMLLVIVSQNKKSIRDTVAFMEQMTNFSV